MLVKDHSWNYYRNTVYNREIIESIFRLDEIVHCAIKKIKNYFKSAKFDARAKRG